VRGEETRGEDSAVSEGEESLTLSPRPPGQRSNLLGFVIPARQPVGSIPFTCTSDLFSLFTLAVTLYMHSSNYNGVPMCVCVCVCRQWIDGQLLRLLHGDLSGK